MANYMAVTKRMDITPDDTAARVIEVSRLADRILIRTLDDKCNDEHIEIPIDACEAMVDAISTLAGLD